VSKKLQRTIYEIERGPWSSGIVRDKHMSRLDGVTATKGWKKRFLEGCIRRVLPLALRKVAADLVDAAGLDCAADRCEKEGTREAARYAARLAALVDDNHVTHITGAAHSAADAAADAIHTAAYVHVPAYAARAADTNEPLVVGVQVLLDALAAQPPAQPLPQAPIAIGDVVQLNSGGPFMSVTGVHGGCARVCVCWFDTRHKVHEAEILTTSLVKCAARGDAL